MLGSVDLFVYILYGYHNLWTEGCGHIMPSFDTHIKCIHFHDKGFVNNPCVLGRKDCLACHLLTPDQYQQLFQGWTLVRVFLVLSTLSALLA